MYAATKPKHKTKSTGKKIFRTVVGLSMTKTKFCHERLMIIIVLLIYYYKNDQM